MDFLIGEIKNTGQVSSFLDKIIFGQNGYEQCLNKIDRKKNGVFFTNSINTVENLLDIVLIDSGIFGRRILEPSCGQGIFILKLLSDIYLKFPDSLLISNFISNNIFFVDVQEEMVEKTKSNIQKLYTFLFDENFQGSFNGITWDFTDKVSSGLTLFDEVKTTPFSNLYNSFDYIIGNPPYVTLYGRRDKKESEEQRINYLNNYHQFPSSVKNGKLNLVMLFIEHSLDFLKENGMLSFIIDVSFFETAYEFTRKYLLENTTIDELQVNIKDFDVASGQVIIKLSKTKTVNHKVQIIDHKTENRYLVKQNIWYNKNDEYKFRYNGCSISKQILDKVEAKKDKTILQLYPNKNLRTCVMLLDMEDKFTFTNKESREENFLYPYYQGSKALSEKYGKLDFKKYFYYDKSLQDSINDELKIELEKQGVKNKKRLGLGETIIYDNPKLFIRQSAKEIIATIDLGKSSANNSLYVFSLRNNSAETIEFLYFLCGFLNTDFVTYYAQQMNIIRFSQGKQPQIKIGDLGTIYVPNDIKLQNEISKLCKEVYTDFDSKDTVKTQIDNLVYSYYDLSDFEISTIKKSIKDF
ncbi:Eco57I restriction-modification methylase [Arcicella aurantiaca]|uniref:site-specific DNA-methyltransferase (adenine-specific) n=1 Tax=Arcicella aurantiaca TaxID=591202 RepID=A0A316EG21_9BACT|nr:TaqI-like C-terminal specificity domain-containing protein [Arcicella aurantiaca]PWK28643.1 Eco57I restriction-modification methylase [Arcicella aurantiaca]